MLTEEIEKTINKSKMDAYMQGLIDAAQTLADAKKLGKTNVTFTTNCSKGKASFTFSDTLSDKIDTASRA